MNKLTIGVVVIWALSIIFMVAYRPKVHVNSSRTMLDSLYIQGIVLKLKLDELNRKADTIIFLHRIHLDYTAYLEYKIDSLMFAVNEK